MHILYSLSFGLLGYDMSKIDSDDIAYLTRGNLNFT
jgi:hypothetical protein